MEERELAETRICSCCSSGVFFAIGVNQLFDGFVFVMVIHGKKYPSNDIHLIVLICMRFLYYIIVLSVMTKSIVFY